MKIIDAKNLDCPKPVILTKQALDKNTGEFKTIVDNEVAKINVIKLLSSYNCDYEVTEKEGLFEIAIKKEGENIQSVQQNGLVVLCKSDVFGQGDKKLGSTLMKSFIYSLTELSNIPSHIIFMNSGVKLALKDSPLLNTLIELSNKGTNVLSCGTCLDFYNVKNTLAIGEITNMYTATDILSKANNVISI